MDIEFTVFGNPKPQSRPRFFKRGNFVTVYDKDKVDKTNFAQVASTSAPQFLIEAPIMLNIIFCLQRPKSHYGTGKNEGILKSNAPRYHIKKPDVDNLVKFVMDSLNKVFWKDDSQVYKVNMLKRYDDEPRTIISLHI